MPLCWENRQWVTEMLECCCCSSTTGWVPGVLRDALVAAVCCLQHRGKLGVSASACQRERKRCSYGKCPGTPTGRRTQSHQGSQCGSRQGAALLGGSIPADPAKRRTKRYCKQLARAFNSEALQASMPSREGAMLHLVQTLAATKALKRIFSPRLSLGH